MKSDCESIKRGATGATFSQYTCYFPSLHFPSTNMFQIGVKGLPVITNRKRDWFYIKVRLNLQTIFSLSKSHIDKFSGSLWQANNIYLPGKLIRKLRHKRNQDK